MRARRQLVLEPRCTVVGARVVDGDHLDGPGRNHPLSGPAKRSTVAEELKSTVVIDTSGNDIGVRGNSASR